MDIKICKFCKKNDAKKICSKCKKTYYCSIEHQVKDWQNHKKTCEIIKNITKVSKVKNNIESLVPLNFWELKHLEIMRKIEDSIGTPKSVSYSDPSSPNYYYKNGSRGLKPGDEVI